MTKREELDFFVLRVNELIDSKYILADVKIVNLLKVIASSETLLALFKNCLTDFDYDDAKKKYFVKSLVSDGKGEFVTPPSSREFLALTFNLLVDIDSKRIVLEEFLNKYFFEAGSYYLCYQSFLSAIIVPFKNAVVRLMESVIEGKLQDPIEALTEEELRKAKEKELKDIEDKKEKELAQKTYGESLKKIKEILLIDKKKVKEKVKDEDTKKEMTLVIDMLGSVIESMDLSAIEYAFIAYKFMAKKHSLLFFKRIKKLTALIRDVVNGI